jgi:hypothetical protein
MTDYSVEWLPKTATGIQAWNQFRLVPTPRRAKWSLFILKMLYSSKTTRFRIREI